MHDDADVVAQLDVLGRTDGNRGAWGRSAKVDRAASDSTSAKATAFKITQQVGELKARHGPAADAENAAAHLL